jgi:hypothetical protein
MTTQHHHPRMKIFHVGSLLLRVGGWVMSFNARKLLLAAGKELLAVRDVCGCIIRGLFEMSPLPWRLRGNGVNDLGGVISG